MQAVKEKLHDMSARRKAKADAKAEEKAEKDLAKARTEIAHEVRLAREAEAEMDLHVAKASDIAEKELAKYAPGDEPNASDSVLAGGKGFITGTATTNSCGAPSMNRSL